jgi:hypothetical protein
MECPTIEESIQKIELYPTPDKICDKLRYCPKTGNYFHTPESLALQPIAPIPDSIKQMMEAEKKKAEEDKKAKEVVDLMIDDQAKQITNLQEQLSALATQFSAYISAVHGSSQTSRS